MDVWRYDTLKGEAGNETFFHSGMVALNYLTVRGWEFVQAVTSGEDNDIVPLYRADRPRPTFGHLPPHGVRPAANEAAKSEW